MSQRTLAIGTGLDLPLEVATQKLAFLGTSGGGKTYAASKLAELMLGAGQQVVILDPVGVWYGLRVGPGGRGQGLEIPVLGGIHGDVPLEPGAGALVADTIVETGTSAVLDVSMLRKGQRKEFATAFAEQLFHRKKSARSALHLFIEEAQTFLPQFTGSDERRMLGAFEDLTKVGRNFGIGHSLISQRPQAVNKDALNQVGTLFVFRTIAKQERRAIEDWIVEHDVKAAVSELPKLGTGEAFVWSPSWLRKFERIQIGKRSTYDASATPTTGAATKAVKLAPVDLAKLETAMRETIERAKADDPKALRARVAELERELGAARATPATDQGEKVRDLLQRNSQLDASITKAERLAGRFAMIEFELLSMVEKVRASGDTVRSLRTPVPTPARGIGRVLAVPAPTVAAPTPPTSGRQVQPRAAAGTNGLDRPSRAILTVLAQQREGCDRGRLTLLSGYRWSGGFRNALGALRTSGLISGANGGQLEITMAGLSALGTWDPLPTGKALQQYWLNHPSLGTCERGVLAALLDAEKGLTSDALMAATGYAWSGGFRNALGKLRTAGLIEGRNSDVMRASAHLMAN